MAVWIVLHVITIVGVVVSLLSGSVEQLKINNIGSSNNFLIFVLD